MSSQAVSAFGSDRSAFFKSAGSTCTTPLEIFFFAMDELAGVVQLESELAVSLR
jgi:hypothetical protein